jgi:hypothetical protein
VIRLIPPATAGRKRNPVVLESVLTVIGAIAITLLVVAFAIVVVADIKVTMEYDVVDESGRAPAPYQMEMPAITKGKVFYDQEGMPYCAALRNIYRGDAVTVDDFRFYDGLPHRHTVVKSKELVEIMQGKGIRFGARHAWPS